MNLTKILHNKRPKQPKHTVQQNYSGVPDLRAPRNRPVSLTAHFRTALSSEGNIDDEKMTIAAMDRGWYRLVSQFQRKESVLYII